MPAPIISKPATVRAAAYATVNRATKSIPKQYQPTEPLTRGGVGILRADCHTVSSDECVSIVKAAEIVLDQMREALNDH
jgi:hypothetical protein